MSYLKALLADFADGTGRALDGLEQSHRWDVLKGMQANVEAAMKQVEKLEAEKLRVENDYIDAGIKYSAVSVELDKAKLEIDRLNALLAPAAEPVVPAEAVQ